MALVDITKYTQYWIYTLAKNDYESFIKYKGMHINYFEECNIIKNDIIILFLQNPNGGFAGVLQTAGSIEFNSTGNKVRIFKDNKLNNYTIKLKSKNMLDSIIKIKDVIDPLKLDTVGYRNPAAFGVKFLKSVNTIINIPVHGQEIMEKLLSNGKNMNLSTIVKSAMECIKKKQIFDLNRLRFSVEFATLSATRIYAPSETSPTFDGGDLNKKIDLSEKNNKISIKKSINHTSSESIINNESMRSNCSDSEGESNLYENNNSLSIADKENGNSNESDNSGGSDNDDSEPILDDPNGYIPIIIAPCENFKLPNKNRTIYFIKHFKACDKCDITNNNNRELCSIIDNATIELLEITDEKHAYFDPALDSYFKLKKFEPMGGTNNYPFIRIMYINNDHDIYNKCIFVTWCDLQ